MYVGEANEQGEILIFDKWANETGMRVKAWRLLYGDVRIEFCDTGVSGEPAYCSLTLASYRAEDLAKVLAPME